MRLREEFRAARENFGLLTLYQKFEQVVVLVLTGLIVVFIVFAIWNLALKIFQSIAASTFDPTDYSVFQAVFGMIFTVIIALEFKWSILVVSERRHSVVQVRAVILIALLAIVRKLIILDVAHSEPIELFALAAAIVALGAVYWLVRDQDRIEREDRASAAATTGGGRDDKERGARNRHSPRARP
ncbi:MAG: phosphate-starvation-inducible PsiE family protein [Methyloceanibacter sp.]